MSSVTARLLAVEGTAAGPIFVKLAALDQRQAFAAEAAGLETLRRAAALRVPRVLCVGASGRGDREADLAMTRLFGGFGAEFYSAYQATWPLDPGWSTRVELYNLYHVLNHLNLFGGGYLAQAVAMIDDLMAELGH